MGTNWPGLPSRMRDTAPWRPETGPALGGGIRSGVRSGIRSGVRSGVRRTWGAALALAPVPTTLIAGLGLGVSPLRISWAVGRWAKFDATPTRGGGSVGL